MIQNSNNKMLLLCVFVVTLIISIYSNIFNLNSVVFDNDYVSYEINLGDLNGCVESEIQYYYEKSSESFSCKSNLPKQTCSDSKCPNANANSNSSCIYNSVSTASGCGMTGTTYTCTKKSNVICKKCSKNYYLNDSKTCTSCGSGKYSEEGSNSKTDCKEYPSSCCVKESNGTSNYYSDKSACSQAIIAGKTVTEGECPSHTLTSIETSSASTIYLDKGGSSSVSFSANGNNLSWSISPTKGVNPSSGNGKVFTSSFSGIDSGTGNTCSTTKYKITVSDGKRSINKELSVCVYCKAWSSISQLEYSTPQNTNKIAAGCRYCEGETIKNGKYVYNACYNRCCKSPTPPQYACYKEETVQGNIYHWTNSPESLWTKTERSEAQCVNCYGNGKYLSLSSHACVQGNSSLLCPNVFPNVTNMDECQIIQEPTACKPLDISIPKIEKETEICEDEIEVSYDSGKSCGDNGFYKIDCKTISNTKYNYDNDSDILINTNNLFAGQGFSFDIGVETKKECVATFNNSIWTSAYNSLNKKIIQVKNDCGGKIETCSVDSLISEYNRLLTILDELINVIKSYNEYNPEIDYNESTNLSIMGYKVNGEYKNKSNNFITHVISKGIGTYTSRNIIDLGIVGVSNPYNYVWTNASNPRIVKMIPQVTFIDSFTGEESNSGLDGGNKIYIDYNTNVGEYDLYIKSLGIAGPNNTITNDKCKINVNNVKLTYRPIDITNPFINDSWKKGVNWINDDFDFTSTIKKNTWEGNSLYSIYLTSKQISELKESNLNNRDLYPYLGLCDNPRVTNKDNITQYICQKIS